MIAEPGAAILDLRSIQVGYHYSTFAPTYKSNVRPQALRSDNLSLFYVCADNSGHLHHVDRLALLKVCKVSDFA